MRTEPLRVLFLCTHNAARSQMAEALLRHLGGDRFVVSSAGTAPTRVHPLAVAALREVGLDIAGARSKHVEELRDQPFDYVITVCDRAAETCPTLPGGGVRLHWGCEDPSAVEGDEAERLAAFRRVRDELAERILRFVHGVES